MIVYPDTAVEHDIQPPSKFDLTAGTRLGARLILVALLVGLVVTVGTVAGILTIV